MANLFWWIKHIALLLAGGFFLLFGINLLISAYQLNDPFSFMMTFFASNFIILISAALLLGFVMRIIARKGNHEKE
ncbi:MAG: hypothetical protein JRG79_04675 [Deltaproteobacteria bacterium]|nr:hypothetical protein [Deltaproteobacteria bacterium]